MIGMEVWVMEKQRTQVVGENIEEMYLISVGKADINARCNGKRTREREKSEQD